MTKQQQQFNDWAGANYETLKQRVMLTCYWDEDVYHDTFVAMHNELQQFDEPSMADLFIRCYKRLQGEKHWGDFVYVQPDEVYFSFLQQPSADEEREELLQRERKYSLYDKALNVVAVSPKLNKRDKEIFRFRFIKGFTTRDLEDAMGMSHNTISRSISTALGLIRGFITPPPRKCYISAC